MVEVVLKESRLVDVSPRLMKSSDILMILLRGLSKPIIVDMCSSSSHEGIKLSRLMP
jgi:hypothetical protein